MEGVLLFTILTVAIRMGALKRPGLIIGLFAMCYAVLRSCGEYFREPDAQLGFLWGGLTMGMLLSVPLFLAGAGFAVVALRKPARTQRRMSAAVADADPPAQRWKSAASFKLPVRCRSRSTWKCA